MGLKFTKNGNGRFLLSGTGGRFKVNLPGIVVTPTPTPTLTPTSTPTPTATPTSTPTPTPTPILDELILRLNAEDTNSYNGSGTVWTDVSPSANNSTLVGNPTFNAVSPKYFNFDGVDDYVTLPANFLNQNGGIPFSISIWFRTITGGGILLGQQASATVNTGTNYVPAIYVDVNGKLRTMTFWGGSVANGSVSTATVTDGLWHNVTVTFESSTQKSYLDGQLFATLSKTQTTYSAVYYYFVGSGRYAPGGGGSYANTDGSPYFTGNIARVDVYARALNGTEVLQNYNTLAPLYTTTPTPTPTTTPTPTPTPTATPTPSVVTDGLLLYIDAGNLASYAGSGTTWNDLSGYGNTVSLLNGTTYLPTTNGGEIVFDGIDDYAPTISGEGLTNFTIGLWVKTTTNASNPTWYLRPILFGKEIPGQNPGDLAITISGGYLGYWIDEPTNGIYQSSTLINDGTWKYVVVTSNGTNSNMYLNGQFLSGSTLGVNALGSYPFQICGNSIRGIYTGASIGSIQFYNRALTPSEILQNYNAQWGPTAF